MLLKATDAELGRTGLAGLMADGDDDERVAVESPTALRWAPLGVSTGPSDPAHRAVVDAFHAWLADQRDDTRP